MSVLSGTLVSMSNSFDDFESEYEAAGQVAHCPACERVSEQRAED